MYLIGQPTNPLNPSITIRLPGYGQFTTHLTRLDKQVIQVEFGLDDFKFVQVKDDIFDTNKYANNVWVHPINPSTRKPPNQQDFHPSFRH